MTACRVPWQRDMNSSVDGQFSARGFSPRGAEREEVLKFQPEKECVGEKCEGFMPEGHVWMFLSGGMVLKLHLTTRIKWWLVFVALPR